MSVLTEEFSNKNGQFINYDSYDERQSIHDLKHADLCSMTAADGWTAGTIASDSSRAGLPILTIPTSNGITTTAFSNFYTNPVDLSEFAPTDVVSVALPAFSPTTVDQTQSFLDIYSGFSAHTVSLAFSDSVTPLVHGDSELRFPVSALAGLDLTDITAVGIRVRGALSSGHILVMAIRVLSSSWSYGTVDMNTRSGRLQRTVPINGDVTVPHAFTQPILWRSANVPGEFDPRPIDAEMGVIFNTGSILTSNSFTLYFRELTEDFLTQIDLDGMTMAELNGHAQPDLGEARYNPRIQDDLEVFDQDDLQGRTQRDLERTADYLSASWIQFVCQWGPGAGQVSIVNTEGNGYTIAFDTPLDANQQYVFFATLEDNYARATIYAVDGSGNVGAQVFDSTRIFDDTAFKRRRGRFGWYAALRDGDSYIDSIRARSLSYAEYRSLPLESNTPVVGAELFATTTPNIEHYSILAPGPYNTSDSLVERDTTKSTTGESWRITNHGVSTNQGVQSNTFTLSDFANSEIHFDLFYPSDAIRNNALLTAVLMDDRELRTIPLLMPLTIPDQWQRVRILMPFDQTVLTGTYKLALYQPTAYQSIWWVDNVSIFSRSVAWDGRAVVDDPWLSTDARWTPFRDTLNMEGGGVLFPNKGKQLQVRARGLQPDSTINRVQFKAKYAELGRFKPNASVPTAVPAASFSTSDLGSHTTRFTDTSTDDGYVALAEWNFGDGAKATGHTVSHQYATSGLYSVTLVVMDNNGNRSTTTNTVSVS